ncbi:hypothetical protein D3C81_2263770 [compost metagenome]
MCAFSNAAGDDTRDVVGGLRFDIQHIEIGFYVRLYQADVNNHGLGTVGVTVADKYRHQKRPLIASSR